jgi:hypothetical protein
MSALAEPSPEREDLPLDLLHSLRVYPEIRAKLHGLLALYAHTPRHRRTGPHLDELEWMLLEMEGHLAEELLEAGWRPSPA